jgi:hypothetical protein
MWLAESAGMRCLRFALVLAPLAGCSYQLVSPPARMVSLETARPAARGETVVGARAAGYAAVFDPGVALASAGVKTGVADQVEVSADATVGHVSYNGYPDIDRSLYAGRLGAKLANQGGWAAVLAGVGAGFAPAAGGFSAADLGGVLSLPNCVLVPFLNGMVFASAPIGAKQVSFVNADGTLAATNKASPTFGFGVGTGIEIPLAHERCRQGLTPPRVQLGLALNALYPSDGPVIMTTTSGDSTTTTTRGGGYVAVGAAVGIEWPF